MVMMENCPKCGKKVPMGASFCPNCGASLMVKKGRSGFLTAAGVLTIIAACVCLVVGIAGIATYDSGEYYYPYGYTHPPEYLFTGIIGLAGFAFGLTAGILALMRRALPLVIIGMSLIMLVGLLTAVWGSEGFILAGVPLLILGILSVVFTGVSRKEFTL
jgi:hypothetical protein